MNRQSRDPYFNSKRAKRILVAVLLFHLIIIVMLLIFVSLKDRFDKPAIVMNVGMTDFLSSNAFNAGENVSPIPQTPVSDPELPPVDSIQDPTPPPELPPEVKQPETVPTTQPKATPPKDPPKAQTKVNPQPKTQPPKEDPPKASKYLTADEILKSSNTKTQVQLDAERKAREVAEAKAKADAKEREALIAGLRDAASQGVPGTSNPGRDGILATKEMRDYYNLLVTFLQPRWKAVSPSNIELGGKVTNWPLVDLTIEKDGKVVRTSVVSRSGNRAIDDAVITFLANLKVVPVPPQAAVIRVTLEIQ